MFWVIPSVADSYFES